MHWYDVDLYRIHNGIIYNFILRLAMYIETHYETAVFICHTVHISWFLISKLDMAKSTEKLIFF